MDSKSKTLVRTFKFVENLMEVAYLRNVVQTYMSKWKRAVVCVHACLCTPICISSIYLKCACILIYFNYIFSTISYGGLIIQEFMLYMMLQSTIL